ncbi:hypothetical protein BsWGS_11793 [Bradybaena similaris]
MSSRCQGFAAESVFDSLEIPMKYEAITIPVQLNMDLLQTSVIDIKTYLLNSHPDFENVRALPEQLALFAVFPNDSEEKKELLDEDLMGSYKDLLTKCQELVLEKRASNQR